MTVESLRYVIKDCKEAIEANPQNPKCGEYEDCILYASQELTRRKS